jgi:hypothetical protein
MSDRRTAGASPSSRPANHFTLNHAPLCYFLLICQLPELESFNAEHLTGQEGRFTPAAR